MKGRIGRKTGSVVWAALLPLTGACATAPPAPAPRPLTLAEVVDSVISSPPLDRTHWGIEVFDPASDRMLQRLNPEKHFAPASNTKLAVTAVSLAELGPDYRYRTDIFALEGGADSLAAGLVVVGRGDPTLSARFHTTDAAPLEALADSVLRAGIRRVDGDLVVDATYFDREWVHPTWEVGDLPWSYAAPVAAFAVAEGTFRVAIAPGPAAGEPAQVTPLVPPGTIEVRSRVVTDTAGAEETLDVLRPPASEALEITGAVPLDAPPDTLVLSVIDPADFAAHALEAALESRGIDVTGTTRAIYDSAAVPLRTAPARRVATWASPPLAEIVAAILKPSQNWIAEQLLKTLGAERGERGSWPAGLEVERAYLFGVVGLDSAAVFLRDGSGLSAQNLLAPHAIVQLLAHARRQPWGDTYKAALPQPGEPGGTLERRLTGLEGRVSAKTGTIAHVNALSGYALPADDRELIFSILTNASGRPAGEVRRAIDRIVQAIVEHGGHK